MLAEGEGEVVGAWSETVDFMCMLIEGFKQGGVIQLWF